MTNIVLETNGSRPRLLEQTLRTLYDNTPADQYNLTVVEDGSSESAMQWLMNSDKPIPDNWTQLILFEACHVTGRLKNLGAYWSEKQFGRGEWICFIDDDVAFLPGWLEQMTAATNVCHLIGGNRHPYHGVNEEITWGSIPGGTFKAGQEIEVITQTIQITDAVAGYSMLMRWETFDKYGPFDAHAQGIAQSEDYAFARRIVDDGGKVGYIHPPVLYHTGVTNSSGQPATGAEKIERKEGILYL